MASHQFIRMFRILIIVLLVVHSDLAIAQSGVPSVGKLQGGRIVSSNPTLTTCIDDVTRSRILSRIDARPPGPIHEKSNSTDAPYFTIPIAGRAFQDLWISNYADLDEGPGVRDWMCGTHTYDGHFAASDTSLRSFAEQEIGVPVFAARDGVVYDAHDGEFDMQVRQTGAPANYVIIEHESEYGRMSLYLHLKKGSILVRTGDAVRAGQQIGLAASSGNSTAPHLHFQTLDLWSWKEPFNGPCNAPELWRYQVPYGKHVYVDDCAFSSTSMEPFVPPYAFPRTGTYVAGTGTFYFWYFIKYLPIAAKFEVRFYRPDGSLYYQSPTWEYGNEEVYEWSCL